jgi:hypothetical protein
MRCFRTLRREAWRLQALLPALALVAAGTAAGAQSAPRAPVQGAPPAASSTTPEPPPLPPNITVAELARLVEEQRKLIAAQQERLAAQDLRLAELEKRLDEASDLALSTHNEVQELQKSPLDETVTQAVTERLAKVEQSVLKVPELAVENLKGEFPGSFKIPGSDAALRIGGRVRMTYVNSFDAIGSDDRFVTSSIPIEGSEAAGKTSRVEFSAAPSRLNFDLRTPTGVGYMRAFIEGDFAGGFDVFRLRHAFGQWDRWLLGQSWSTFSDPEAEPDGIDFEGLNAISMARQPQIRWTRPLTERLSFAAALEEANPELTGAEGVNQVPDLVVRIRWDPEAPPFPFGFFREGSHVQAALLVRQLRGETEDPNGEPRKTLSTTGYGLNLSGVLPSRFGPEKDKVRWAWNFGKGIGRYISDLNAVGGQDAVFDADRDTLDALPVAATYAAYEHWWGPQVRSTLTAGFVWVDNIDSQTADSLRRTERFSLNLAWSPIPRLDIIAEYLWGRRINLDAQSGHAGQLQVGSTFRF